MSRDEVQVLSNQLHDLAEGLREDSKTVNGEIKRLDQKLELYIGEAKVFREVVTEHLRLSEAESLALKPILERVVELTSVGDGLKTVNNLSRFLKWLSGFTVVGGGLWYILVKLIR